MVISEIISSYLEYTIVMCLDDVGFYVFFFCETMTFVCVFYLLYKLTLVSY